MAPTLSGLLFKSHLWLAFLINGTSIFCSAMLIGFLVKDTAPSVETGVKAEYQKEKHGESTWQILKDNRLILLFVFILSGYFAVYQIGYVYLMPLDLAEIHGDSGALIYGSVTSINCVVVVLFTPVITRLFGSRSEPERLSAGVSLVLAGFVILMVFMGHIPMYYVSMTVLTWGEIFAMTADSPYLSRRIPSSHRGRFNGVVTVVRTVVTSLSQLALGWLYAGGGSKAAWMGVMVAGAVTVCASFVLIAKDRIVYPNLYSEK
jgi:MFS family permease